MEAPEFAQSDKLRRVFTALENRAYLGELVGSVAGSGTIQRLHRRRERADSRCATSRSSSRRTAGRAGRSAWSASSGPTRMSYPQAIGTVRFVSGLMNELVDHLVCLSQRRTATRAQERIDEIDISPTRPASPRSRR